ncbi:MAG: RNA 2',3'-cyclic phosphodiesterase [Thermoproteota archaeon]
MNTELRAFISLDIENEDIIKAIRSIQESLLEARADLKLVEEENLHFTLLFLGEISGEEAKSICNQIRKSSFSGFRVFLKGLGVFPDFRFPRVVWIGAESDEDLLKSYARAAMSIVTKAGVLRASEDFTPHLTIARVKSGRNKRELVELVSKMSSINVGETRTSPMRLKESCLTSRGPIYRTICEAIS